MSKRTETALVCDIEDDYGQHPARHVIRLGLDGKEYEGDFCDGHAKGVRLAFAPFISAGRLVRGTPARRDSKAKRTPARRRHSAEMRAWAKDRGLVTGDRGRMPDSVVAKYEAAKRGQS